MPPNSDGEEHGLRTVGVSLVKLVPDANTLADMRRAVERVHHATIHATALLNLHVRRAMQDGVSVDRIFDGNWLINAFYEVTSSESKKPPPRGDADLAQTAAMHLPANMQKPKRDGLTQLLQCNANLLATVGKNNVWMHFRKRLLSHVTSTLALPPDAYKALSKDHKRLRRLQMLRIAEDLCRPPGEAFASDEPRHAWVVAERARLGIDAAVGSWGEDGEGNEKNLLYHLKEKPHRFLPVMALMSREREARGGKAMALFPLRRDYVPKHVRFDAKGFDKALQAMRNERLKRKCKSRDDADFTFDNTLDYSCVCQPWRVEPGFTTDGVTARVQQRTGSRAQVQAARAKKLEQANKKAETRKRKREGKDPLPKETPEKPKKPTKPPPLPDLPKRGIYSIDQLKHLSRLEEMCHFIGIDPGKLALLTAADMDDKKGKTLLQYTQRERLKAMRSRQYADESKRSAPFEVRDSAEELSKHNSKSANLQTFKRYVHARNESLAANLNYYGDLSHRQRRWKTYIKAQTSESKLFAKIAAMHKDRKNDKRQIVLAYGSWGLVAGRAGSAVNKGNPPCVGVGLMRKLSKRFLVVPTPEQFSTATCRKCKGRCGAHKTLRRLVKNKKTGEVHSREVHGLRVCQNESCGSHLKRDGNAAFNIGTQLQRLLRGDGPIRTMTDEDLELHRHNLCLACDGEAEDL